jgi:N-acetylmuramoyl-L-alanine amidase
MPLADLAPDEPAYWIPPQPSDLPPTIIRRQPPPAASELSQRWGQPAAIALTVAAVTVGGFLPAVQSARAAVEGQDPGTRSIPGTSPADQAYTVTTAEAGDGVGGQRATSSSYTVQPGDALWKIADRFGVSTMALINANDLANPDLIHPGQVLTIPGGSGTAEPVATSQNQTGSSTQSSYTVQSGDTLSKIAARFGVSIWDLAELNGIGNIDLIIVGQVLQIPGAQASTPAPDPAPSAPAPVPASSTSGYTVQAGDTLAQIAARFNTSVSALLELNPSITNPDLIIVGQTLVVTGTASSEQPTVSAPADPPASADPAPAPAAPSSNDIGALLEYYANQYGLDPNLVKALAWVESGWRQGVVSSAGAVGVMQVMPGTGDYISRDLVGQPLDIRGSTADNIHAGVAYLAHMYERFGTVELALTAYLQGPVSAQNSGPSAYGRQFIARVLELRDHFATHGTPPR